MDLMQIRRMLLSMVGGDTGLNMQKVTINSQPTTSQGIYDAIQTALGDSAKRWIAICEYSLKYPADTGAVSSFPIAVCGAPDSNQRSIYRNDGGTGLAYSGMRRFNYGTSAVSVPVGTEYYVYVWAES